MRHIRAEAKLDALADRSKPEMGTLRRICEVAAGNGDKVALRRLRTPECPEEMEHLVRWTYQLFGRDGFNMGGPNLLSNREMGEFFRLRRIEPDPLEVDALFEMNAAYCNPEGGEEDEEGEEAVPQRQAPAVALQPGRQIVVT